MGQGTETTAFNDCMQVPGRYELNKSRVTVCLSLFCVCVRISINFPTYNQGTEWVPTQGDTIVRCRVVAIVT